MLRFLFIPLAASLCLVLHFVTIANAQTADPAKLEQLQKAQAEAKAKADKLASEREAIRKDIARYKKDLIDTAAENSAYERASQELTDTVSALRRREDKLLQSLADDQRHIAELLAALQRISHTPPPALVMRPDNAADAAKAAQLIAALTAQIEAKAAELTDELDALKTLQKDAAGERRKLAENETALTKKRRKIRSLVEEKDKLDAKIGKSASAERAKAKKLATEAKSLGELIAKVERSAAAIAPRVKPSQGTTARLPRTPRLKPKPGHAPTPHRQPSGTKRFTDARGFLTPPAQGRISKKYTAARKGVTLKTHASAQVLAPYSGRIEFAGAFKNYDNLVILNVGEGYFILLTGLGDTLVKAGESVKAGAPVGQMPGSGHSDLYIEFRKRGRTVNPMPWLGQNFGRAG